MTVVFLGSGHDDPSGSERLQRSVQSLKSQYGREPDFVAFEYAWSTYIALASKRSDLAVALKAQFPQLPEDFISHFANTLGYEGDLSKQIAAPSQSVWMLDGWGRNDTRIAGDWLVEVACDVKKHNLATWLLPQIQNWRHLRSTEILKQAMSIYTKESETLASLSGAAATLRDELKVSIQSGRDSHMFESVRSELTKRHRGNHVGVVVVGEDHLLDAPGSLFNLCCSVTSRAERVWPHQQ
jgi:hypothetical protein